MKDEFFNTRCRNCKYYGCNECTLLARASIDQIDTCILDWNLIKAIEPNSLDEFVFFNNPIQYLQYLGYREKENYPKAGDTVLTLSAGFSTSRTGKFLTVDGSDDYQIFLSEGGKRKYSVQKERWYLKLFNLSNVV
jgi:hypothetical protein